MKLSEPDAGAYAWKPQIINYELKKSNNLIIWMDAEHFDFILKNKVHN